MNNRIIYRDDDMPNPRRMLLCQLPWWPGMNGSWIDNERDHQLDQQAEWLSGADGDADCGENQHIEELRLDHGEIHEFLWKHIDWSKTVDPIAKDFAECFGAWAGNACDALDMDVVYDRVVNDHLWAWVPYDTLRTLRVASRLRRDEALDEVTNSSVILEPITDWAPCDLGELMAVALPWFGVDEDNPANDLMYFILNDSHDTFYSAVSDAIDWEKYEADVEEKRASLLEDLRDDQPDHPMFVTEAFMAVRCDKTPDLFEVAA